MFEKKKTCLYCRKQFRSKRGSSICEPCKSKRRKKPVYNKKLWDKMKRPTSRITF